MTAKEFYKAVLSKITFIGVFTICLFGGLYCAYYEKELLGKYLLLSLAILIVSEIIISFIITLQIIARKKIEGNKKTVILFLIVIPYIPALLGTIFYSVATYLLHGSIDKFLFICVLTVNFLINFICSLFLNSKTNIFRFLNGDK